MSRSHCIAMVIALTLGAGTAAAEEQAREDTWWQAEGRDRDAYLEAGFEMTLDDGDAEGTMGDAGNVELTTGYWFSSYLAAELQLAIGRAVNPGIFSDTRIASTHGAIGAGLRLAAPIRLSPIVAAHLGYRQILDRRAELTCGDECGQRTAVAFDVNPDEQVFADAEAGLQLNLGTLSLTATVEWTRPLVLGSHTEVMTRAAPGSDGIHAETTATTELGFNLQAGVRF